jgi:ligand-binding SRPBCC domain-containing protein
MTKLTITKAPRGYRLHAACTVPRDLDEVFTFFSNAANLERITPPWIRFQVLTTPPLTMRKGLLIDYKLRIRGLPLRWQSEITAWEPQSYFVDEQRRGPYSFWRHEHRFEPCDEGTRVIDDVNYGVPGGPLVHALLVRRDVAAIFHYRQQALLELFPTAAAPPQAAAG